MNRLTLNLARRPGDNLRRVRWVWGGTLAVLLVAFVLLGAIALTGWLGSRPVQRQTDALRAQMIPLQAERSRGEAPLHNPKVRAQLDQAGYINGLIARKSVSWTRLFERLEEIMPPGVELVSLRPLERNGANAVDIRFASDSMPPAINFVQALENSGDFAQARVERETVAARGTVPSNGSGRGGPPPPKIQLEVTTLYEPARQMR
ncbi:MAG TPA: hypothetical protein VN690_01135 [Terriglobales bacterium]|nr:hypothetical protein [Terriglobales bacterium]